MSKNVKSRSYAALMGHYKKKGFPRYLAHKLSLARSGAKHSADSRRLKRDVEWALKILRDAGYDTEALTHAAHLYDAERENGKDEHAAIAAVEDALILEFSQ